MYPITSVWVVVPEWAWVVVWEAEEWAEVWVEAWVEDVAREVVKEWVWVVVWKVEVWEYEFCHREIQRLRTRIRGFRR
jgi:hypothetical protein